MSVNQQGDIPEFHRLVGEAIRGWANAENQMWWFAALLLGVDQFRARIIISSIAGTRAKREFIFRLAETYLDPVLLSKFRSLLERGRKQGHSAFLWV